MTPLSAARQVAACVLAAAIAVIALPSSASAQASGGRLAVRIYDFSALDTAVRTTAIEEGRGILADVGVNTSWHDCAHTESCAPEPGDLIVRVVREPGAASAEWRQALGYSVVDPARGTGTLATIYINRVENSARHAGADLSLLLGRAIAHEVGHLVLHTNEHSAQGLMRPIWTEQEMARNAHDDWVFATPERRQIRAALQRASRSAER
jgi:hypothetical protein